MSSGASSERGTSWKANSPDSVVPAERSVRDAEFGVFEEAPDTAGNEAFEAAGGFSLGLAFTGSADHVVLGGRAASLSGDRNEVERPVELAITTTAESMAFLVLSGGDLDRSGSAESGIGTRIRR
jgi:hypothetical protein